MDSRIKTILSYIFISVALLTGAISCSDIKHHGDAESAAGDAAWISLAVENGEPSGPLSLIAGQEYVFDRITLAVDNRNVVDNRAALEWLTKQSSFSELNWDGVRETRAHWRNFRESRSAADVYAHVFEGAKWMNEVNGMELSVRDAKGVVLGAPLRFTQQDFLNQLKQQDFDMIKAEFRYENFARHKDRSSAKIKRAVAKIVFAVQTNLSKRLAIPANAHSLRLVWDKKPREPYDFPIRLVQSPYNYGGRLEVKLEPDKPVYFPGDTIRATFTLRDQKGVPLKFSEFDQNGIRQLNIHLDGPVQDPTYYHEEWLSEFRVRYAYHVRAPALGFGTATESTNTALKGPPLDADGASIVVDLHVPQNLPKDKFGSFEIGATAWRNYASQSWIARLDKHIQVGQKEPTEFERFGCKNCHAPNTPMELGLLIPPMVGVQKLTLDSIESCVLCHDNSRNGSRRLDKYLHLIHMNRDKFPVAKNNCAVCHLTADSIKKVHFEVCSNCHESLHRNNQPKYTDAQCQNCHQDYNQGHIGPVARR
ncbi:MAG: hypothetical protein EXR70_16140 [Deltaproteobacteria bacterium]|nr:hypothetical protein [Deltaproteobacteria bacterium]